MSKNKAQRYDTGRRDPLNRPIYKWKKDDKTVNNDSSLTDFSQDFEEEFYTGNMNSVIKETAEEYLENNPEDTVYPIVYDYYKKRIANLELYNTEYDNLSEKYYNKEKDIKNNLNNELYWLEVRMTGDPEDYDPDDHMGEPYYSSFEKEEIRESKEYKKKEEKIRKKYAKQKEKFEKTQLYKEFQSKSTRKNKIEEDLRSNIDNLFNNKEDFLDEDNIASITNLLRNMGNNYRYRTKEYSVFDLDKDKFSYRDQYDIAGSAFYIVKDKCAKVTDRLVLSSLYDEKHPTILYKSFSNSSNDDYYDNLEKDMEYAVVASNASGSDTAIIDVVDFDDYDRNDCAILYNKKTKKYSIQRHKKDVEGTESDSIIELKDKWFNREKDDEDEWF